MSKACGDYWLRNFLAAELERLERQHADELLEGVTLDEARLTRRDQVLGPYRPGDDLPASKRDV
jgi:hypothetical protein